MFTGIVETLGQISEIKSLEKSVRITIKPKKKFSRVKCGDSIAINGVCLSVVKIKNNALSFDVVLETMRKTNLRDLKKNDFVNMERAMKFGDRIEGHYVLGHVESNQRIKKVEQKKNEVVFHILYPKNLSHYIVPKGCISVNGVSLTIGRVYDDYFSIYLIPHTIKNTTFQYLQKGSKINLETDIMMKRNWKKKISSKK